MKSTKATFNLAVTLALTAAIFAAAAGDARADGSHGGSHHRGTPDIGMAGNLNEVGRTVEIKAGDTFFEPESIRVKPGETIRFVVKNSGKLVHEFNIGTPAMHAAHQREMTMMVEHGMLEADKIHFDKMKMDMGNGMTMEHNDPNSVLVEPGKTREVIWKFTRPGKIEFACNIPGHYDVGMVGLFQFAQ